MKKLLKMLGIAFMCMLLMSTAVFAEESLQEIDSYGTDEYSAADFGSAAQNYHSQIFYSDEETFSGYLEYFADYEDILSGFEECQTIMNSEDEFIDYGPYALYQTENGDARIYQVLQYEKANYVMVCGFDSNLSFNYLNLYKVKNIGADDEMPDTFDLYSFDLNDNVSSGSAFKLVFDAETLKGALGNTLIGMGVVFSVLIFISILIGLFKYISPEARKADNANKAEVNKASNNKKADAKPVENEKIAAITAAVITDETQLVAAITAAISACEGVSSDSFVVRTIKKRNW